MLNSINELNNISIPEQEFTNEKGNVKVGTREALRKSVLGHFTEACSKWDSIMMKNVNGGISIPLCRDSRSGDIVWAHVELTINTKSPRVDSYTGKEKAAPIAIEIPNLFGDK